MTSGFQSLENPKVLHVVWNLMRGGTEGQCARLAIEMARAGGRQRVAVFRREGFFLNAVEAVCGQVHEVGIRHMLGWRTVREVRRLRQFLADGSFDVVHCWDADAAIFGVWASRLAGVPCITSRRDLGEIYARYKLWLMHRADLCANAVVINADSIFRHGLLRGVPASRIVRVPNIMDVNEYDGLAQVPFTKAAALPQGRLVGLVARLFPEKDVATFLEAARIVAARVRDVSFVIAGDGPQRVHLESLGRSFGLADRLVFLGDVTEVPALVRRLQVGVLVPSGNEGLSNSILEYMSGSLPVVATDCGGNRELVEDGVTGCVVPPGDAEGVAAAVLRLLDDPVRAAEMGRCGRQRVEQNFRPDVVARRFAELYRRIAKESSV